MPVLVTSEESIRQRPVQAPGIGRLCFEHVAGRTVLTRASATSPLKILNPRNAGASAWAYLATYGGGLVGGDRLDIQIEVGPQATALVATQASTKVYRSDLRASQELDAGVAENALLVALPDPVTCFAGSDYAQDQRIRLHPAASLVLVDRLTAGRIESGERWRFNGYAARTRIWEDDRLVFHDALRLAPIDDDLTRRMGRFNCVASIVLLGPAMRETASRLLDADRSQPVIRGATFLASAAPLGNGGALLRIAGVSVEQVAAAVREYLSAVSALLGDDPWARRW
jgi:urease accessory protein